MLLDALSIQSDCFFGNKQKPVFAHCIITLTADPVAALTAATLYFEIKKRYGCFPLIICAAAPNRLECPTGKITPHAIFKRLNIEKKNILQLTRVPTLTKKVKAVSELAGGHELIWCVPAHLSLELCRMLAKKVPRISSHYCVINEVLEPSPVLLSTQELLKKQLLLHELAAAYARFLAKNAPAPDIKQAGLCLLKRYRLRLPNKTIRLFNQTIRLPRLNLRSFCQYLRLLYAAKRHKQEIAQNVERKIGALAKRFNK